MVTELLGELIAVHHAADFAARRAARGEDDALRRERLAVLHAGGKGAAAMAQLRDHTAGAQLDLRPLKRVAQHAAVNRPSRSNQPSVSSEGKRSSAGRQKSTAAPW